jgi:hypothetical protein
MVETNRTEVFAKISFFEIKLEEASKILHYFNKLATNKVCNKTFVTENMLYVSNIFGNLN